jgi:dynein heavy chain
LSRSLGLPASQRWACRRRSAGPAGANWRYRSAGPAGVVAWASWRRSRLPPNSEAAVQTTLLPIGTQNSIALLTQQMQHGTIFDRADLGFRKEIVDVQYITAMNPTAGSFEICERAQIRFATFSCQMPSTDDLQTIYEQIFDGHLKLNDFSVASSDLAAVLTTAAIKMVDKVATKFLPTSIRFTYFWTMRELSNIFQNICLCDPRYYTTAVDFVRLWRHEVRRVLSDRMVRLM